MMMMMMVMVMTMTMTMMMMTMMMMMMIQILIMRKFRHTQSQEPGAILVGCGHCSATNALTLHCNEIALQSTAEHCNPTKVHCNEMKLQYSVQHSFISVMQLIAFLSVLVRFKNTHTSLQNTQ